MCVRRPCEECLYRDLEMKESPCCDCSADGDKFSDVDDVDESERNWTKILFWTTYLAIVAYIVIQVVRAALNK